MNRAGTLTILTIPSLMAALALAEGLTEEDGGIAALQEEYEMQQARIDLAITRFSLEAARGEITQEEAQGAVDRWLTDNSQRLEQQAALAAQLDLADPLPPPPAEEKQDGNRMVPEDSPDAVRYAQVMQALEAAIQPLRAQAESPEQLQGLVDSWCRSPEGQALHLEKWEIERDENLRRPLGTQPVVLEVDGNAPPSAVAALEIQERAARRIMDIREQHPDAGPGEMQGLIDARIGEFRQDAAEANPLLQQAALESLEATVALLEGKAGAPPAEDIPAGGAQ